MFHVLSPKQATASSEDTHKTPLVYRVDNSVIMRPRVSSFIVWPSQPCDRLEALAEKAEGRETVVIV
jgi:hypothetical protein